MRTCDLQVLIVDDNVFKTVEIKKALEFNGIRNIISVRNQEAVWDEIDRLKESGTPIDLIVTDMHYPLRAGLEADHSAGFILIERMKEREIRIPVIICSTRNFHSPDTLGTVWYNELRDIEFDFKELLQRVCETKGLLTN